MEQTKDGRKPWELSTAQEIYDGVVEYLASRTKGRAGAETRDGGVFTCRYRSPVGPCAVGWLLRDDEFVHSPDKFNCGASELFVLGYVSRNDCHHSDAWTPTTQSAVDRLGPHAWLLSSLQDCHDEKDSWRRDGRLSWSGRRRLLEIGRQYSLRTDSAIELLGGMR